ncbi:MAG: PorT family protein [Bacteroidetes bacterium]|nr:PorT family protein [Bacteroidota bacterium]MBL6944007.1 PorT family protein [Bacteroidales bacterium]
MRRLVVIIFILLIFSGVSKPLIGQIIKGETLVGINLTQVEGDEVHGFRKPGLNIGAGALIPFSKNWDVSLEVTFNQKGANQGTQYNETDSIGQTTSGAYKLRLNYVEVPVLIHYTDKEFISVGAGFSWGRLVSVQEWEHGIRVEETTLNSGTYDKNDFSYILDARIKIKGPLKFGVRYQNSLVKIRTREFTDFAGNSWTRDQFNKVLTFRLIYIFNEEQSRRNFNKHAE